MQSLFSALFIFATLFLCTSLSTATEHSGTPDTIEIETETSDEQTVPEVININLDASNDGWDDEGETIPVVSTDEPLNSETQHNEAEYTNNQIDSHNETAPSIVHKDTQTPNRSEASTTDLPGEDVNFNLDLHSSTHHIIEGRADSDIGKVIFKSRLMPSNEVKVSLNLKQSELDDIELLAYFDLANFTMELDGGNSVLNKDHKRTLNLASLHLRPIFEAQYKDFDFPEHTLMLVQMMSYWSVSPKGFVHEKRSIVSQ